MDAQCSCADRRRSARRRLLRMHFESKVGHLGGNLSALDILLTLYHDVLAPADRFVLSKGHAAGAMYVTLWTLGRLGDDDLSSFHRDGTLLSGHPPVAGIPELPFATGSLGHGPSLAAGLALARQLRRQPGHVWCLTSDGEWNEGSCWEALVFARQRRLNNLTLIVDANGLQGFGSTRDVADLEPLADRFRAFRCDAAEVDGHDPAALRAALAAPPPTDRPRVLVARTTKGKGVPFMEGRMEWHYLPLTEPLYREALAALDAAETSHADDTPAHALAEVREG